jgi:DNA-directed RNA polymerase sigma subunit (sigma70/sigma32)
LPGEQLDEILERLAQAGVALFEEPQAPLAVTGDASVDGPLAVYQFEVSRIARLTRDDAIELLRQIETSDDSAAARRRLLEANLWIVLPIAQRLSSGQEMLDLVIAGNEGLLKAIEKYDWRRAYSLSMYATWWIHRAIERAVIHMAESGPAPIPVHKLGKRYWRIALPARRWAATMRLY